MKINPEASFGTRECPGCATEVAANHNRCPICGYVFPQPTRTQSAMKWAGALIMLAVIILVVLRLL